mmetsp:Transcript_33116/g.55480  ORF Transcript_33116/g.55480 Transcript_33116/m.55480 type:complete len:156 (-) Transcript_33116:83-550(-)|eukprot:CAMPEP_0198210974 /NCGR_PEP_ID=MMETSP1445-20131203/22550_1 /TAXON_ID=36898 /ORGANISM="Pyramimonas sp., Strain CCMP2087" /LENGTH=155 /DNA_ID=CAMNT_0043885147 /DNA_START=171 /DNA_END=638 /DNA_ORIENTATION=-
MPGESAAERKERLQALRAAAELATGGADLAREEAPAVEPEAPQEVEEVAAEEDLSGRTVKFRNYLPKDDELLTKKVPAVQAPEFEEPVIEPTAGLDEQADDEDAIASLAPRKANWDLRRDVAKKLEKLERRTQKAMVELMQESQAAAQAAEEEED